MISNRFTIPSSPYYYYYYYYYQVSAELRNQGIKVFPGKEAHFLYSTMGFPIDLTKLMAEEQGLGVDLEGFQV